MCMFCIILDNPALVFKTIADVVNKESSPNSDEEGKLHLEFFLNNILGSLSNLPSLKKGCQNMFGILLDAITFCVLALEALFGPDFDLVTSARFLPKTVLGILTCKLYYNVCTKNNMNNF